VEEKYVMRIAMPSDDQRTLARHIGRCGGFVVVEAVDGAVVRREWRPNVFTSHARGEDHGSGHQRGEGRHTRVLAALADCQMLVARGMGQSIHDDLCAAGIEAYTTDLADVEAVLEAALAGTLADRPERRCSHDHDDHEHTADH
jgi:predicted Fe-Mo cluster-binding NifX family protein